MPKLWTPKETNILLSMRGLGSSNASIARRLGRSAKSVKSHIGRLRCSNGGCRDLAEGEFSDQAEVPAEDLAEDLGDAHELYDSERIYNSWHIAVFGGG